MGNMTRKIREAERKERKIQKQVKKKQDQAETYIKEKDKTEND